MPGRLRPPAWAGRHSERPRWDGRTRTRPGSWIAACANSGVAISIDRCSDSCPAADQASAARHRMSTTAVVQSPPQGRSEKSDARAAADGRSALVAPLLPDLLQDLGAGRHRPLRCRTRQHRRRQLRLEDVRTSAAPSVVRSAIHQAPALSALHELDQTKR